MQYTPEEIRQYAAEEDVKFIRMAFCDVEGRQKNIAIMARASWTGHSGMASPLTVPLFRASAGRSTPICCCTRTHLRCAFYLGGRSMAGWCGCSRRDPADGTEIEADAAVF